MRASAVQEERPDLRLDQQHEAGPHGVQRAVDGPGQLVWEREDGGAACQGALGQSAARRGGHRQAQAAPGRAA